MERITYTDGPRVRAQPDAGGGQEADGAGPKTTVGREQGGEGMQKGGVKGCAGGWTT